MLGQLAMRRLRDAHVANGLSPRQFHLLALLHDQGPIGQRELGLTMDIDPSILVTMLNPLEHDGLVCRLRDSQDRRRHVVTLTEAGEQHLERATRAQRDAEQALFAGLGEGRRELLEQLLLELQGTFLGDQCGAPCLDAVEPGSAGPDSGGACPPATICD